MSKNKDFTIYNMLLPVNKQLAKFSVKVTTLIDLDKVATKNGVSTVDNLFSTALLALTHENILLSNVSVFDIWIPKRISDKDADLFDGMVFGVGQRYEPLKLKFDKHPLASPIYEDGTKLSSFGMLSKELIPEIWGDKVYENLKEFIKKIDEFSDPEKNVDLIDKYPITDLIISIMNSNLDSGDKNLDEESDEVYLKKLWTSYRILKKLILVSHHHQHPMNYLK